MSTGRLGGGGGGGGVKKQKSIFGRLCGAFWKKKVTKFVCKENWNLKYMVLILNFKLRWERNDNTIQYKTSRFPFLTKPGQISYREC